MSREVIAALDLTIALGGRRAIKILRYGPLDIAGANAPARVQQHDRSVVVLTQHRDLPGLELRQR
jgi:hypothetical protein